MTNRAGEIEEEERERNEHEDAQRLGTRRQADRGQLHAKRDDARRVGCK